MKNTEEYEELKNFKRVRGIMVSICPNGKFGATFPDGLFHTAKEFSLLEELLIEASSESIKKAAENKGPKLTGEFENDVRCGYYNFNPYDYKLHKEEYKKFDSQRNAEFTDHGTAYLISNGVPDKYSAKVFSKACQDGHSGGYTEVLNCMYGLIEIFRNENGRFF